MTLTLNLRPGLEERLQKVAEERGQDLSECALALLEEVLEQLIENEPRPTNGAELVAYWKKHGVIGDWANRTDIGDSVEYARKLREEAQRQRYVFPDEA